MKYVAMLLAASVALASAQPVQEGSTGSAASPMAPLFQTMMYRNVFDMNFLPALWMANMNGGQGMFGGANMQNPFLPLMMWKMF